MSGLLGKRLQFGSDAMYLCGTCCVDSVADATSGGCIRGFTLNVSLEEYDIPINRGCLGHFLGTTGDADAQRHVPEVVISDERFNVVAGFMAMKPKDKVLYE